MEREEQGSLSEPSQMAVEGWSYTPEQRRAIMTATRILSSGTLDEESFRLLEQLANRTRHRLCRTGGFMRTVGGLGDLFGGFMHTVGGFLLKVGGFMRTVWQVLA
jgi:hypothetical protein